MKECLIVLGIFALFAGLAFWMSPSYHEEVEIVVQERLR